MNPVKLNLVLSLTTLAFASLLLYASQVGVEHAPPMPLIAALAVIGIATAVAVRHKAGRSRKKQDNRPRGKRG